VLDREQSLDETEADALCGLADMLQNYFCVAQQPQPMKPRPEDIVRLAQELPADRLEAAWQALVALL
jgi:hypothetical protein